MSVEEWPSGRPPTWLYYALSTKQDTRGSWSNRDGVSIFDRPGPPAAWSSDDLRALGTSSLVSEAERFSSQLAVIARPWGRTRQLRENPSHPENRAALHAMLKQWGRQRDELDASRLWFVPGWVLDAWVQPRFAHLPTSFPLYVRLTSGIRGTRFQPGKPLHAQRPALGITLAPLVEQLAVLEIADPSHAPGLIRPGLVLDARMLVRPTLGRPAVEDAEATAAFRNLYLGRVIEQVPAGGHVLPGEPLEDICARTAASIRRSMEAHVLQNEMAEEATGPPGLV